MIFPVFWNTSDAENGFKKLCVTCLIVTTGVAGASLVTRKPALPAAPPVYCAEGGRFARATPDAIEINCLSSISLDRIIEVATRSA